MGHAKHVGRIGALAVALGVGVAIGAAPGVAWADETGSSETSAAEASPSDADNEADDSSVAGETNPGGIDGGADGPAAESESEAGTNPDEVAVDETAGEDDAAENAARPGKSRRDPAGTRVGSQLNSATLESTVHDISDPVEYTVHHPLTATPLLAPSPDAAVESVNMVSSLEHSVAVKPESDVAAISLSSVLSPLFGSDSEPVAPVQSPAVWVLLAAARRELGSSMESLVAPLPVTAAPQAVPSVSTPGWFTGKVSGRVNAKDPDGDELAYGAPASTPKGTLTVNRRGFFTFTPSAEARHAAAATSAPSTDKQHTFTITVDDGTGNVVEVPITVVIKPSNSFPTRVTSSVGSADAVSGLVTGAVTARDTDDDTLGYVATAPSKGVVTVNADGTFVYTPSAQARIAARTTWYTDTDRFRITVDDGHGGTRSNLVTVRVAPSNHAPVAGTPSFEAPNATTGAVIGALNASDPDGDPVRYSGSATTSKGKVTVTASGRFTYTPTVAARHDAATPNGAKTDSFTVVVKDSYGAATSIPVTVAIPPANTKPTAKATVGQPDAATGIVIGAVAGNDADGDHLTFSASGAKKGTVTVAPTGTFTYTPTDDARHAAASLGATTAARTDSFTISVSDGHSGSATVAVTIAITPSNSAPIAASYTAGAPDSASGIVTGAVTASDADNDALVYSGPASGPKGTVVVGADGTFTYTPTADARAAAGAPNSPTADREDSFIVTINDGHTGGIATVSVTVTISPPATATNASPTAIPAVSTVNASTGRVVGTVGGADADGDSLSYRIVGSAFLGTAIVGANGTFTYQPTLINRVQANSTPANDLDVFIVEVSDGHNPPIPVRVYVPVAPAEGLSLVAKKYQTNLPEPYFGASGIAFSPDGTRVYITGPGQWGLYNTVSGTPIAVHGTANKTAATTTTLTGDGLTAYTAFVGSAAPNYVLVNDALTGALVKRIIISSGTGSAPTAELPSAVEIRGSSVYVVRYDRSAVVIDMLTNTVSGVLGAGTYPPQDLTPRTTTADLAYYAYTTGFGAGEVRIVDRSTETTLDRLQLGFEPSALALTPDGRRAFVVNAAGTTFAVIELGYRQVGESPGTPPVTVTPPPPYRSNSPTSSGVVTGFISVPPPVNDPGGTMRYEGSSNGPLGNMVVTSDGNFTFTPSVAARERARTSGKVTSMVVFVRAIDSQGNSIAIPVSVPILAAGRSPRATNPLRSNDFLALPGAINAAAYEFSSFVDVKQFGHQKTKEGDWLYLRENFKQDAAPPLFDDSEGTPRSPEVYLLSFGHMAGDVQNGNAGNPFVIGYRRLELGQEATVKSDYPRDTDAYVDHGIVLFEPGTFPHNMFTNRVPNVVGGSIFNNEIPGVDYRAMQEVTGYEEFETAISATLAAYEREHGALKWAAGAAKEFGETFYGGERPGGGGILIFAIKELPEGFSLVQNTEDWPENTHQQYLAEGRSLTGNPPPVGFPGND